MELTAESRSVTGQIIVLPPATALKEQGPRLRVSISLHHSVAQRLLDAGTPVPAPVTGFALIDTGASTTSVDEESAKSLGLGSVGEAQVASASERSTVRNMYPVTIEVEGLPLPISAPQAIGAELRSQGLLVLIGRDVLQFCTLFYNGLTGQITLAI
jgi:predicted aspartyl protease